MRTRPGPGWRLRCGEANGPGSSETLQTRADGFGGQQQRTYHEVDRDADRQALVVEGESAESLGVVPGRRRLRSAAGARGPISVAKGGGRRGRKRTGVAHLDARAPRSLKSNLQPTPRASVASAVAESGEGRRARVHLPKLEGKSKQGARRTLTLWLPRSSPGSVGRMEMV